MQNLVENTNQNTSDNKKATHFINVSVVDKNGAPHVLGGIAVTPSSSRGSKAFAELGEKEITKLIKEGRFEMSIRDMSVEPDPIEL